MFSDDQDGLNLKYLVVRLVEGCVSRPRDRRKEETKNETENDVELQGVYPLNIARPLQLIRLHER